MIIDTNDDVRNYLKSYFERVVAIQGLNFKIQARKDDLMPKMTMTMSGMPRGNGKSDPTADTVVKWDEDETIKGYYAEKKELKAKMEGLKAMLNCLTKRESKLLETYYINKHNARVTANRVGISESSVNRMTHKAIVKLKELYDKYYK